VKVKALAEICDIVVGRTPARADTSMWGVGHSWLSIADMSQGQLITRTKEEITDAGARTGRRVEVGTVLLSFKLSIGKVAIAGIPLYTNEAIAALKVRDNHGLEPRYLMRALQAMDLDGDANRAAMGATLNKAKLAGIMVPIPTIGKQRRIAAILDQADALRVKRRQVLAHLDTLIQSTFHDMFGDLMYAGTGVRFGDIASLVGGRSLVADDAAADSEYRVLKISAVTSGQFDPEESKALPPGYKPPEAHLVHPGELLMSRANTTDLVGAVAYVRACPSNLALPDKIWRFVWRDSRSVPLFYHALFGTPAVREKIGRLASGTGGSMKNVSKEKLSSLELPDVGFDLQERFAQRAEVVSQNRAAFAALHELDHALFTSLQARAFRDEL